MGSRAELINTQQKKMMMISPLLLMTCHSLLLPPHCLMLVHHHTWRLRASSSTSSSSTKGLYSHRKETSATLRSFSSSMLGADPLFISVKITVALLCAEWVKGDSQRFATGLDLDLEALHWGLHYNIQSLGTDACARIHLFHGNVLRPISFADLINTTTKDPSREISTHSDIRHSEDNSLLSLELKNIQERECGEGACNVESYTEDSASTNIWPGTDIICSFNYSCCCLSKRSDLVSYFKYTLKAISEKGGIFVMDLYGGLSSECALKFHKRFDDFTYIWEQENFDVLNRTTRISLHFRLKNNRMLHHAFSYNWRLWSLPEVRDCLEEAGFNSVHFWIRSMPDLQRREEDDHIEENDAKYEEVSSFSQRDAWNAYIVAVRKADTK